MDNLKEKVAEAFIQLEKKNLGQAEFLYRECMEECREGNPDLFKSALLGLGNVKSAQGKFDEAQEIYQQLFDAASRENDWEYSAVALHQLGAAERLSGKLKTAKETFIREYDLLQKHMPSSNALFAANYYEHGLIALSEGKLKAAKKMMQTSLDYALKSDDLVSIGYSYRGNGAVMQAIGRKEEAVKSFATANKMFGQAKEKLAIKEVQAIIAELENANSTENRKSELL
ncbi:tetratricopeptide repeat protein [Planococcus sp. 107-1]|uniref:tetratricopeptide repeat protein n=1 Tax=Planococcus sp. 107-1 TaxID=2908840 RepID=UPI001F335C7F|nr:tetratricopeptide repeat protein [Planococcus sp. 107-1]UJF28110.1 tetratricopeptide repeat protein [Planococcus sp. 107-1]